MVVERERLATLGEVSVALAPVALPGPRCGPSFGVTESAVAGAGPAVGAWYGAVFWAGSSRRPALEEVAAAEKRPSVVGRHAEVAVAGLGWQRRGSRPSTLATRGRRRKWRSHVSCVGAVVAVVAAGVVSWMVGVVEVGAMVVQTVLSRETGL